MLTDAVVHQLLDELLAESLDVHGAAAGEMHDPLGALRAALEHAARALVDRLVFEPRVTGEPHTGQFAGMTMGRASAGRCSGR